MNIAISLLPIGLMSAGAVLTGKDANSEGADDAIGQVCIVLAPIVPDVLANQKPNGNATLKAMRALEQIAHDYRMLVGDVDMPEAASAMPKAKGKK